MVVATNFRNDVDEILPGVVADRRHLHENPELGFQEHKTAAFVTERLQSLGVEDIRTGINSTGVTGLIRGIGDGPGKDKVVLVRADMDALPILEENQVDYRSTNDGVMHACGHDAHTAMLLGLARVLTDNTGAFAGTVKLLFQPAEELPPGGAKGMIGQGVLEDPHVDAVLGLHVSSDKPTGQIIVGSGPIMAAADGYRMTVQGKGGHGASPHRSVDPIAVGAYIVTALQTLVSREVDPIDNAVVSNCVFHAGEAFNVIPDTAKLAGTVRTFQPETRDLLEKRIGEVARGVGEAMNATVDVEYIRGYPATANDPAMAELVLEAARGVVGEENVEIATPKMGAEDFSYFLIERPGCFFFVGTGNPGKDSEWAHHHPRFDIDEDGMAQGMAVMAASVVSYLNGGA
jgi:amidohydrolase